MYGDALHLKQRCAARAVALEEKTIYAHCRPIIQAQRAQQRPLDVSVRRRCHYYDRGRIPLRVSGMVPEYSSRGPTGPLDSLVALVHSSHQLRTVERQPRGRSSNKGRPKAESQKGSLALMFNFVWRAAWRKQRWLGAGVCQVSRRCWCNNAFDHEICLKRVKATQASWPEDRRPFPYGRFWKVV